MMKKTIFAACAVLLVPAFVSCQKKSDVERCLDAQSSLVETLQKINDKDSAEKYADEAGSLLEQFFTLFMAINNSHRWEELKTHPQWEPLEYQLIELERRLRNQGYYGSERLRAAFLKRRGK
ncbi:MAG: hypothetical protein LUE08_06770 [Akkermansiaceae bacterium]|nr:hypothetical protein [Akkermansiaceae bacterium]